MQVILKRPGECAKLGYLTVEDSIYNFLDSTSIDSFPLYTPSGKRYQVVFNIALPDYIPFNIFLGGVYYYGNIFVCGIGDDFGYVGLTNDDIDEIASLFDWSDMDRASLLTSCITP